MMRIDPSEKEKYLQTDNGASTKQHADINMYSVFMQSPVPICIFRGKDYILEFANPFYLEILGKTADIVGKPIFESFPELKNQGLKELIDSVIQSELPYCIHEHALFLLKNNQKTLCFFNCNYQPLREQNGEVTGVIVVFTEVTEQVLVRKKIEDSEKRYSMMLMQSPFAFAVLKGKDMVVSLANDSIKEMWGKGTEIEGKPLLQILPEIKGLEFLGLLNGVMTTGVPFYGNEILVKLLRGGKIEDVYFNFVYQPYLEADETISGVAVIAYEVTAQAELNKKTKENKDYLERAVENRTKELEEANQELQQKNNEIAISKYNKLFLTEFSEKFSSSRVENEFFNALVQFLVDITKLDYAFVAKFKKNDAEKMTLETIAVSAFGKISENFDYSLIGGPCGQVMNGTEYVYAEDCKIIFPKAQVVLKFQIDSFIGLPLYDAEGDKIGLVAVMHDAKIEDIETVNSILKIVAKRAEMEYERIRNIETLKEKNKQLEEKNKELAQKNKEIEESKEKEVTDYKYALDASSIVEVTDAKGVIKYVNDNFLKVSKFSREELIGNDHNIINSGFHSKEFMRDLWATIASGQIWKGDLKNKAKDGSHYWLATTIVPFLNEQGIPYQYVAIRTEITEQKRIQKELIEAKVFAEVAATIAEDAKTKAEEATVIAENAVKAKQQFLSNMSHEIRTPMNAIIGFTKVMLKTELTGKQKEYLTAVKMSGDSLIVLINDILDLAKVDAGKMTFERTPFKLALSISAMLHLFEIKIQEKNLVLITEYDNKIPEVLLGDPVRLHQIILNLVGNAVKFTAEGHIKVSVKLKHQDDKKVTIQFDVNDTGIGINESKMATIFDNFQQSGSDTTRLYGGTGLGLAIVKQLVEPQGGTISVKSKITEGSTFTFTLDFEKTDEEALFETEIMELDASVKNIKVLVVEDMALNQLLMKTILDDFGFDRDIADNGKIAVEKLTQKDAFGNIKTYDVILMDLQMPEMNGFEATAYIRNTLKLTIPIIALTADVTTADLAKCKAVGMNDYIAKPVDERLLYSKIVSLVKKSAASKTRELGTIVKLRCTNLNYLMQRTKSNPALMSAMIDAYLEQTPPLIHAMKQSFRDKNWDLLHSAVHKMIPSFAIMGISNDFEAMAKKVMEYAKAQREEEILSDFVLQLEDVCTRSCDELREELNKFR